MFLVNRETLEGFQRQLQERECAETTVAKYMHDVTLLSAYCGGEIADKATLIAFKEHLQEQGYALSSVNSMLAAVNSFLGYIGRPEWRLRYLKAPRSMFRGQEKELTRQEYERMVSAAKERGNERLELLVQTICATGIRVSEVRAVTVDSLRRGWAEIRSKGRIRTILLPKKLCRALLAYCRRCGVRSGQVFVTRTGRPLDRSNIWKMMKRLGELARVKGTKVYPHNLRHLFARTYYRAYKDIVRLADILGHASIDTTRIYTVQSGEEQQRQMERLPLLI